MKSIHTFYAALIFLGLTLLFGLSACEQEDDGLPITNDLRILQVSYNDQVIASEDTGLPVLGSLKLVFSHGLNTGAFEGALSLTPAVPFELSYDGNNSFAILEFTEPLAYETAYTVSLPRGTYGAGGETSVEDFSFNFTTAPFNAPSITLSTNSNSLFEGEVITVTANLSMAILEEVSMDLVFGGAAIPDTDFSASAMSINIPAGSTSGSVEITALDDAEIEGEEDIVISLNNIVNGVEMGSQELVLSLGDAPPALEIKGVMSLKIGGTENNGRAVHFRVLEDIPDLSVYGIGIANNGGGSDGREIDFPAGTAAAGDDILLVRDVDEAGLAVYFGDCYNDFELVIPSDGLNFNGDDPFELYKNTTVIETYGDVELDGTGEVWEWTGSWAYKLNGVWEYGQLDCSANSTSVLESSCPYPFCVPLQLQGVLAILWDGSGTNGGKAVHVRANRDIADLSSYGLGVANNGGGTDGIEFTFPAISASEGDHILVAREPATIAGYFGGCFDGFAEVIQSDDMNQNGDDAIELFNGMDVIETYGDANVNGTGESWEYSGSWGYKIGSTFIYGGIDCAAGSTTTQESACVYPYCN
jgi:hypothetical protein